MYYLGYFNLVVLFWIPRAKCMSLEYSLDEDIAHLMTNKGYLPEDKNLPEPLMVKTSENDTSYILTKLSDEELLKLLNKFPNKNEDDMEDFIKVSGDSNKEKYELENGKKAQNKPQQPIFRLENKEIDQDIVNKNADQNYNALQKLNNMLYSRPKEEISTENDDQKEIIFDILVAQLKTLCCKKNKHKNLKNTVATQNAKIIKKPAEYIFLVVNDEIKSNTSDELIHVDPDSLSRNSSVLLLGPITTPLSDMQTKLVVNRISTELSKPEYLPLLNKISEGNLGEKNSELLRSFIAGPETRRYLKPHRCNYQAKLSKIYGGPKWIICTGYLNLNTPSLYD